MMDPQPINNSQLPNNGATQFNLNDKDVSDTTYLSDPSDPKVYHTTLNLALSSNESTDQGSAFWNTWNQFTTGSGPANIQTWQGRRLYYYRNDPNGVQDTTIIGFNGCALDESTLILNEGFDGNGNLVSGHNSGQCGSFARLLIGALAVNGIHSQWEVVAPASQNTEFLVKDWTPPQANPNGPWNLCESAGAYQAGDVMVPAQANGVYCDLTSMNTLPGQNTTPPSEKIFGRHFIVSPQGVSGVPAYVDPSYGVKYDSQADFQSKAVFGYFNYSIPIGAMPNPLNPSHPIPVYGVTKADPTTVNLTITP